MYFFYRQLLSESFLTPHETFHNSEHSQFLWHCDGRAWESKIMENKVFYPFYLFTLKRRNIPFYQGFSGIQNGRLFWKMDLVLGRLLEP
jgi:hypothetical protein